MIKNIVRPRYSTLSCLTLLFIFPLILTAQHTISITGTVQHENGEPLSFATVAARDAEQGKVLQGVFSDESGAFHLEIAESDSTYLEVSMIGYVTQGKWLHAKQNIEAGIITLVKGPQNLEAVVVTGKRNKLTRKIDRLVVDVEDNAAFAGRPAMALLSSVPGVFVQDGKISINGVYGTRVMINGRLLQLKGDDLRDYLRNIKADDIKSVEVIAHPPAEYDAEGSGGFINIVLKKNTTAGLTMGIGNDYSIGLGRYPTYKPNVSLDYRKGKFSMSAGYNYVWTKSYEEIDQQREMADEGDYRSTSSSIITNENHNVNFSAIYDFSDRQFIGFDYRGTYGGWNDALLSETTINYPESGNNSFSVGEFPSETYSNYSNVGLNYSLLTDTLGSKFSVLADFTYRDFSGESGTNSSTFAADGTLLQDTAFTFFYPSTSHIVTAEAKYEKKFSKGLSLTFGGKLSSTVLENVNSYGFTTNEPEQHAFDYDYDERVYAGFISASGAFAGVEYNVGLRGEQSEIAGDLLGAEQDTSVRSNYFNLFPNLSLQRVWDKDNKHTTTLSYSKRISRPSFQQLNPYQYFIDNYSVSTGNPYLTPEFRQSIELGHLFKQRYYASLSYTKVEDVINYIIQTDPASGLMTVVPTNSGENNVYTATFSIPFAITKWWSTTNNLLLTHTEYLAQEFHLKQYSFVGQTEQQVTLPKGFALSLSAYYTPKVLVGNVLIGRVASVDLGLSKSFFKDRLTTNVNVSDIFYTNNYQAVSYFNGDELHINKQEQTRMLTLSLRYHINIGKAFKARKLEKSNADEKDRL